MHHKSKEIQNQFEGFLKTPFLWNNDTDIELEQLEVIKINTSAFNIDIKQKLRLGKLVERFVSFELQQDSSIKMLAENIQIQEDKRTLGELDCLLLKGNQSIHLEIVYKFYLYDSSVGKTEIERWIGPNRRDSFIQKLTKLKEKQLPLLYSNQSKFYLDKLNLSSKNMKQQVYFKAQLFVPLKDYGKEFPLVNNDCICGFYINSKELNQFSDCKFYIPTKHNWLVKPHSNISWLNFDDYKTKLQVFLYEQNSPLCWIKQPNGEIFKFFLVWWDA